jgi:glyoxylase-like metal-dependent hydrolase (beta-lactamase superfamily II)
VSSFLVPKVVDLKLPLVGFREFISSWIFEFDNKLFIIDPGPTNSIPLLIKELSNRVPDYILLTHIHVDHAGGTGTLCNKFPDAKIVSFEKAHKHLIDPTQLIIGSREVAGDKLMDVYGDILPVNKDKLLTPDDSPIENIITINTPGHASHHISYIINDYVFCGEALGIRFPLEDEIYLRPATPPPFRVDIYQESILRLSKVKAKHLLFAHFGMIDWSEEIFELAYEQINLWVQIIKNNQDFESSLLELQEKDKLFSSFKLLDKDIQDREKIFLRNTFDGIMKG